MQRAQDMRTAMADYVRTVHQAYVSASAGQPPAVLGRLPLFADRLTVLAAGAQNLHVLATTDRLAAPSGQEVAQTDEVGPLRWDLRFFDPVVLPPLGLIDEAREPAYAAVRRALGVGSVVYHLVVQPGARLDGHQAGHAGAGLAMDHLAAARDFESIRAKSKGAEALVDELEIAAIVGLPRAQAMLAAEVVRRVAPWDETVAEAAEPVARGAGDTVALRRAVLAAVRGETAPWSRTRDQVGPGSGAGGVSR